VLASLNGAHLHLALGEKWSLIEGLEAKGRSDLVGCLECFLVREELVVLAEDCDELVALGYRFVSATLRPTRVPDERILGKVVFRVSLVCSAEGERWRLRSLRILNRAAQEDPLGKAGFGVLLLLLGDYSDSAVNLVAALVVPASALVHLGSVINC
jgi:hypothetical protein